MAGERSFSTPGAPLSDLEEAWKDRLVDAEHLNSLGRYPAAITMGLYSLEILLKTRICLVLKLESLPKPFEIHDLEGLLFLSGLRHSLKQDNRIKTSWEKVCAYSRDLNLMRYSANAFRSQQQAEEFFTFLNDQSKGVIPWILLQV